MHVSFKIHYRNNLIDQKDSYPIPRPPSWDDRNYSYGHQLYPSAYVTLFQLSFGRSHKTGSTVYYDKTGSTVYCDNEFYGLIKLKYQ
jgi:hypothetical protein